MTRRSLAISLSLALATNLGLAEEAQLIPPMEAVSGMSQVELSVRWWQWAFSFERARSPIADLTGQMCASRQMGDVWFLAGTYGTRRTVRTCKVPAGKILFFPLINYVAFRAEGSTESCKSIESRVMKLTDDPGALVLEIDGKKHTSLQQHRLHTDCFSLIPGQPSDAAADGYFVAIRPLSKGRHELNFGGVLPSMTQAVTYTLEVE